MARYIDAIKLEEHFRNNVSKQKVVIGESEYTAFLVDHALHEIRNAPAEDVQEVKHGHWSERDWSGLSISGYMACSECNVMIPTDASSRSCLAKFNYCPNCGAKMDGAIHRDDFFCADGRKLIEGEWKVEETDKK